MTAKVNPCETETAIKYRFTFKAHGICHVCKAHVICEQQNRNRFSPRPALEPSGSTKTNIGGSKNAAVGTRKNTVYTLRITRVFEVDMCHNISSARLHPRSPRDAVRAALYNDFYCHRLCCY